LDSSVLASRLPLSSSCVGVALGPFGPERQRNRNAPHTGGHGARGTMTAMRSQELAAMLSNDERHWWYRGRRRVLRAELDRLPLPTGAWLLDAGCGSGRTLDELARYGTACGVDISETAVASARGRGHDVRLGAVETMPFPDGTFDVVTCLDVIEHTADDRATLRELLRVTRPGGLLIVTVPAYQALWSWHDEANLHYRRYGRRSLRAAADAAGWQVVSDTHFNALLLAPAAVVRIVERHRPRPSSSDLARTPPVLNSLLEIPLILESRLLAHGGRLPVGLSLLAILRRPVPAATAQTTRPRRMVPALAA
jgi:SAM-dependent methyltransferase